MLQFITINETGTGINIKYITVSFCDMRVDGPIPCISDVFAPKHRGCVFQRFRVVLHRYRLCLCLIPRQTHLHFAWKDRIRVEYNENRRGCTQNR